MSSLPIPKGAVQVPGQTADATKQMAAIEKDHWQRVGAATEKFNQYLKMYGNDYNLTREELAQALYLEVLNWKEFWPDAQGGPAKFDELSKEVWNWFQANKDK
jgi:hypothetical protein